jgi:hypothetical protein
VNKVEKPEIARYDGHNHRGNGGRRPQQIAEGNEAFGYLYRRDHHSGIILLAGATPVFDGARRKASANI